MIRENMFYKPWKIGILEVQDEVLYGEYKEVREHVKNVNDLYIYGGDRLEAFEEGFSSKIVKSLDQYECVVVKFESGLIKVGRV